MTESTTSHAGSFSNRITQAVENIVRPLHQVLENEIAGLVDELATAIAGERTAALEQARDAAAAEKETAVKEALAAASAEHDIVVSQLREALTSEHETALRNAMAAASARHDASVNELRQALTAERDTALNDTRATLEAAHAVAVASAVENAVSAAKEEAAAEIAAVRLAAEREKTDRVAETAASASDALRTAVTEALASERQADLEAVGQLLETIRAIDSARSMGEILDTLGSHAFLPAGRVAVFLVRDGKLRGWRLRGFGDLDSKAREVELSLDDAGVIARAVQSHACAATSDRNVQPGEVAFAPPGGLLHLAEGRAGFAAPVCIAGEVVAVVYADEGDAVEAPVPSSWPELVEIIARHGSRCVELLMVARIAAWTRTAAEEPVPDEAAEEAAARTQAGEDEDAARRYARLLISEIKLYHESDVNQGKRERDLLQRLRPEIDRARRLFDERVPPDVRARTDCFDQELVRTLADGNASLLGQST